MHSDSKFYDGVEKMDYKFVVACIKLLEKC